MKYSDGNDARLGDKIDLGGGMVGVVVAIIDDKLYSSDFPATDWTNLRDGLLVDSPEAGIVHYPRNTKPYIELISRKSDD